MGLSSGHKKKRSLKRSLSIKSLPSGIKYYPYSYFAPDVSCAVVSTLVVPTAVVPAGAVFCSIFCVALPASFFLLQPTVNVNVGKATNNATTITFLNISPPPSRALIKLNGKL